MKQKNKKNIYKYGSFVKYNNGGGVFDLGNGNTLGAEQISGITNMLGSAIGGDAGSLISGAGSGAALGTSVLPGIGTAVGGALGLVTGLIGGGKRRRAERRAKQAQAKQFETDYFDQLNSNLDINNDNPYGVQEFALGGMINPKDPIKKKISSDSKNFTGDGLSDFTNKKGQVITAQNIADWKASGLDWGSTKALGDWYDTLPDTNINPDTSYGFGPLIQRNRPDRQMNLAEWNHVKKTLGFGDHLKSRLTEQDFKNKGWDYNNPIQHFNESVMSNLDLVDKTLSNFRTKKMANGGEVIPSIINIEKGELQINPENGKILREYKGINPETGGLYEPHNKKGKDTRNNMVSAEEGSFIITKKEAKNYKDAIDRNDKMHQNSILQNIRNYKKNQSNIYNDGSFVFRDENAQGLMAGLLGGLDSSRSTIGIKPNLEGLVKPNLNVSKKISISNPNDNKITLGKASDFISQYGPSLLNIGRGLFENPETVQRVNPNINPYKSKILSNMPQDVSLEPVRRQLLRQQQGAFNQIDNSTHGSPIARANKQNVIANTQNQLGKLAMEQQMQNNQVRQQRGNTYNQLAGQELDELARVQQINLGIDDVNAQNRAAKRNLLSQGLSQLQKTYLNNDTIEKKKNRDDMQVELMKLIGPAILPYLDNIVKNKKR